MAEPAVPALAVFSSTTHSSILLVWVAVSRDINVFVPCAHLGCYGTLFLLPMHIGRSALRLLFGLYNQHINFSPLQWWRPPATYTFLFLVHMLDTTQVCFFSPCTYRRTHCHASCDHAVIVKLCCQATTVGRPCPCT